MLGVSIDSGAEFAEKLGQLITGLPTLNWWSVANHRRLVGAVGRWPPAGSYGPLGPDRARADHHRDRGGRPGTHWGQGPRQGGRRAALIDLAECRPRHLGRTHPLGARPHPGDHRGGAAGGTQLRAEAELLEQARPGPAGFRWRQHRRRAHRRIRRRLLDLPHGGAGSGRVPDPAASIVTAVGSLRAGRVRHRAARAHPLARYRRHRRHRGIAAPCSASRSSGSSGDWTAPSSSSVPCASGALLLGPIAGMPSPSPVLSCWPGLCGQQHRPG